MGTESDSYCGWMQVQWAVRLRQVSVHVKGRVLVEESRDWGD